jgi:hypothetical protein
MRDFPLCVCEGRRQKTATMSVIRPKLSFKLEQKKPNKSKISQYIFQVMLEMPWFAL